jgi:hypothetical protein
MNKNHNIRDAGATGDGATLDSPAIQRAIDAAADAGGGTVTVPPGRYRCGTLHLRSGVHLHLHPGATLVASHDLADFPKRRVRSCGHDRRGDRHNRHLLVIDHCRAVTISGGGTIDGQGPAFWRPQADPRAWIEPRDERISPLVEIVDSEEIRIHDVTLRESPGWTLHALRASRLWLRGVTVRNHPFGPNNDGFDINGCRDVFISDCDIDTCDDAIVLKTTRDARACERVVIQNCILRTNCAAVKCGTESWHDFRHITVTGCVVHGATRAIACYAFDGGTIENLVVSGLSCDTNVAFILNHPIHLEARQRTPDSRRATIRQVRIQNVAAVTDGRVLLTASDGCTIEQVALDGLSIRYPLFCDPAPVAPGAASGQASQHAPEARAARAAIVADGVRDLLVRGLQIAWPTATDAPGWGGGLDRIENGGPRGGGGRRFGPADQGDDVDFSVVWGRRLTGAHLDLGPVQASGPRAPRLDLKHCQDVTLTLDS